ncbi:MAG TPA: SGNH/GDSL hydrolase family protein [Pseudonocardiaceae bacterium]|nr:SGNH/GDSL hydrolase family protein [Pseudonocardiaceae bacterium]
MTKLPAVLVAAALTIAVAAVADRPTPASPAADHWVDTWVSMPQLTEPANLPPAPFTQANSVLTDTTLRQTIHISIGGRQLRLRFSNAFGGTDLPITGVSVALPAGGQAGASAIQPGSSRPVSFDGRPGFDIPVGAQAVTDPLNFPLAPGANLTVTMYLATGQASTSITSHPGSRTTSYLLAGNHLGDADLPGATPVDHWYFLSGAEMRSPGQARGVAILGDSLTDGRGSTTNGNDRWPDDLSARLRPDQVAVLNQAAGGNRVLHDGLGPNALGRVDRDVLAQSGIAWLIVFEGVNDIGTADATPAAQQQVVSDLIAAYQQIITRVHTDGIRVYGATITPFGGNTGYDDPDGYREAARQAVNNWIRTSHQFDAVLDFDRIARDPAQPRNLLPAFDVGDHLHLDPAGYQALANAVPAQLFGSN